MRDSAEKGAKQNRISPKIEEGADYYARLGVSARASQAEIAAAFRDLSKQFHPDAEGGGDSEKMKLVSEAYSTLKDPEKRAQYSPSRPSAFGTGRGGPFDDIFRGGQNFDDLYADIFGRGRGGRSGFRDQNPDDLARSMGYRDFQHYMEESEKKKAERKTNPEIIREEAVEQAKNASYLYKSFIDDLKKEGIPNADDLIRSEEVVRVIVSKSISEAKSAPYLYGSYVSDWVKNAGFDRSKADTNPELISLILTKSISEAKSAPYLYGSYIGDWIKHAQFDRRKADLNPELISTIKTRLLSEAKSAAYLFKSYLDDWKKHNPNLNVQELTNAPEILDFVRKQAESQKRSGEYFYKSFLDDWRKAGVDVSKI